MSKILRPAALSRWFTVFALAISATPVAASHLDDAVRSQIRAVQMRDLPALEQTITSTDDLTLVLPNGTRTVTRQAYIDFHRNSGKRTYIITTKRMISGDELK